MARGRPPKFQPGDRFRGRPEGVKAWIRDEPGTIIERGPGAGEYHVKLSGEETWVQVNWIDRV